MFTKCFNCQSKRAISATQSILTKLMTRSNSSSSLFGGTSRTTTTTTDLLLRVLLPLFHLQATSNGTDVPSSPPSTAAPTCPAFQPFPFWLRQQCPPMTDYRCVAGLPVDLPAPLGQLSCASVEDLPNARLKLLTAREMLHLVKYRDPVGRPWCLLSLFYSPECVFSAKVADSFYQLAHFYPKLRVVAIDVSQGGKDTENLISQYGIASTPVIALWQDGFPRYRLYDDYSRPNTLVKVIRTQTDLLPRNWRRGKKDGDDEELGVDEGELGASEREPSRREFLGRFKYLQEDLGFDWYLLAAVLTCLVNLLYFGLSSRKGRALLEQNFPGLFGIIVL